MIINGLQYYGCLNSVMLLSKGKVQLLFHGKRIPYTCF